MARDISFLQYMRAHGNTPGPTQRPYLTGAISGVLAQIPALLILYYSGALESLATGTGTSQWLASVLSTGIMAVAGILYAAIFKRAANDFSGGWLFGISYGFLLWLLSPLTLWQLITSQPIAVGGAAMGLFGTHVVFGLALGFIFPRVHCRVQLRLQRVFEEQNFGRVGRRDHSNKGR